MRICFVYKEDYPWDVRVEKICNTLRDAGHEVHLVCHNINCLPRHESSDGVEYHRLSAPKGPLGPLIKAWQLPFYVSPAWRRAIERCCRDFDIDLIIVRDIPLALMAIQAGRRVGARVILDMAECYPLMYESSLKFVDRKVTRWLIKNPKLAAMVERRIMDEIDHVFVMIEESRDRLLDLGVPADRISIVSNTPVDCSSDAVVEHRQGDPIRLFYIGFLTRIRGVDIVVDFLRRTVGDGEFGAVEFDVVGVGPESEHLRQMADLPGLADRVRLHGWLEMDAVKELARRCNVGVLPYRDCSHWNHTIPNKLFDYMRNGYPVLTTAIKPISRIVRARDCGVVFEERDEHSFERALARLASANERHRLADAGHQAITERYNWARDASVMLEAIERVMG